MKFCQFAYEDAPREIRAGYVLKGTKKTFFVVDINKADPSLPKTLLEILQHEVLDKVIALETNDPPPDAIPLTSVALKAPITGMDKILGAYINYKDFCKSRGILPPEEPILYSKFPSCVIGPSEYVKIRTGITKCVDWEVHLAYVFSKTASNISQNNANDHLLGCTVAQDISARDWLFKRNAGQGVLGKSMDTFCPLGPWIVTLDELGDPDDLNIKCSVNGVEKQSSNTSQMVYSIASLVEHVSSVMTMLPGDIILTGTPPGSAITRDPPEFLKPGDGITTETEIQNTEFLKPGDVITSEIQNIGSFDTKVVTAAHCDCSYKKCYNKI